MTLPNLRLKPRTEHRLRGGHLWIYSNEVDNAATPIKEFEAGQLALLEDSKGKALGTVYVHPNTLISARILCRDKEVVIDAAFIRRRVESALALREQLFAKPFYRLVYGESDGLPGLVVDRFGDALSVQINTAGMERFQAVIIEVLETLLKPSAIVLRNDASVRQLEGLNCFSEQISGAALEYVDIEENDTHFRVPILNGQKTGWFYDHRVNRNTLRQLAPGKRVLDVFSYIGGWGIQAATAGAADVTLVDSSGEALNAAEQSAELNGCTDLMTFIEGNAQEVMKTLTLQGERFDIVVLDPPAFIKRRKDVRKGEQGYRNINELALRLLNPGGILVSASCSMHLGTDRLIDVVRTSAAHYQRMGRIINVGMQGPDHPIHPAIPETSYLKAIFTQLTSLT